MLYGLLTMAGVSRTITRSCGRSRRSSSRGGTERASSPSSLPPRPSPQVQVYMGLYDDLYDIYMIYLYIIMVNVMCVIWLTNGLFIPFIHDSPSPQGWTFRHKGSYSGHPSWAVRGNTYPPAGNDMTG